MPHSRYVHRVGREGTRQTHLPCLFKSGRRLQCFSKNVKISGADSEAVLLAIQIGIDCVVRFWNRDGRIAGCRPRAAGLDHGGCIVT